MENVGEAGSFYQSEAGRYFQEAYQKQTEGLIEDAICLYQKSIELYPTAEGHTFLGWAYSFQGRYEDAIQECRKAIRRDPEYGNPYNDIGAYLIETGRHEAAVPWLEKAIHARRYESYCYAHYNLGRVRELQGDWPRALECYRSALKDNPAYTLAQKAASRVQGMMN